MKHCMTDFLQSLNCEFSFSKICGFFYDAGIYSLPNCPYQIVAYQNVAFITYQIVTYQIVAYPNVAYQNVTYQIYLTKNPPVSKTLVMED